MNKFCFALAMALMFSFDCSAADVARKGLNEDVTYSTKASSTGVDANARRQSFEARKKEAEMHKQEAEKHRQEVEKVRQEMENRRKEIEERIRRQGGKHPTLQITKDGKIVQQSEATIKGE